MTYASSEAGAVVFGKCCRRARSKCVDGEKSTLWSRSRLQSNLFELMCSVAPLDLLEWSLTCSAMQSTVTCKHRCENRVTWNALQNFWWVALHIPANAVN